MTIGQGYILVKSKVAFVKKVEAWAGSLMVLCGLKRWVVRKWSNLSIEYIAIQKSVGGRCLSGHGAQLARAEALRV